MSSLKAKFPFLELLSSKKLLESPVYIKMCKRSGRNKPDLNAPDKTFAFQPSPEDDMGVSRVAIMIDLDRRWHKLAPMFSSQIALVSDSFIKAVKDASDAFRKDPVSTSAYLAKKTFAGTILIPSMWLTCCYKITFNEDAKQITDFSFLLLTCFGTVIAYITPRLEFLSRLLMPLENGKVGSMPVFRTGDDAFDERGRAFLSMIVCYLLFCHFAHVDVKFVARPGSREARKQSDDENALVNDTHLNVRHLTEHYYTTICRDEGFPVRGHFRLQPIGTGRAERKLIFIAPFTKNGYHRRAELLTGGEFGKGIKN